MQGKLILLYMAQVLLIAPPAHALCSGETLQDEFREADLVVRAKLVSEINAADDAPSAAFRAQWGNGAPVVLYGLRVLDVFKGRPGPRINFFEERNSGAFYLDMDGDYLLFLHYIRPYPGRPRAARGAMYVRYACGQSKSWHDVKSRELATLRRLSMRR
ncbi:MAG TPA: hypothetical protein VGB59_06670 [Allosphingosinicella sp.]|jgi:hypothetical protein